MKFVQKIFAVFLLIGLVPLLASSVVSIYTSTQSLEDASYNQLVSVRDNKLQTVTQYLSSLSDQVDILSTDPEILHDIEKFTSVFSKINNPPKFSSQEIEQKRQALKGFYKNEFSARLTQSDASHSLGDASSLVDALSDKAVLLQDAYITQNPNPVGSKDLLIKAKPDNAYNKLHGNVHEYLSGIQKTMGFYDVFLTDVHGNVVYSVFKEVDFATSLVSGPYSQSGLARAFQTAKAQGLSKGTSIIDFDRYLPSFNAPAAFISAPVVNHDNQLIGTVIAQFPLDNLNAVMGQRAGLGETGESYLVGKDYLMRSDSYLTPETHSVVASFSSPETGKIETQSVELALSGKTGIAEIQDYNNHPVLSAYAPVNFAGLGWVILAEVDTAEAFSAITSLYWTIGLILIGSIIAIIIVTSLVTRSIVVPIGGEPEVIKKIVEEVATGNLTHKFNDTGKETGIYLSMSIMVKDMRKLIGDIQTSSLQQTQTVEQLSVTADQTSQNINLQHENTTHVASAMYEMTATSNEVSKNTSDVALSTTETRDFVSSSSDNVTKASQDMQKVASILQGTSDKVSHLNEKANDIAGVLQTITGIADQTNLLALNAAIEAARAGEQGRGFAVVADEVRNLAQNTQKETESIAIIIDELLKGSNDANSSMSTSMEYAARVAEQSAETVQMLESAVTSVENVSEMTLQIASASEEQTSVSNDVSQNIETINNMSNENDDAMKVVSQSIAELSALSKSLKKQISHFEV